MVSSEVCHSCRDAMRVGEKHPAWKGGVSKHSYTHDECPNCGGQKTRESKQCKKCRTKYTDRGHMNAAQWHNAYRRTPVGRLNVRRGNLKKYGLTPEQYDDILIEQDNKCASCGKEETAKNQFGPISMAVDHDHNTNKFRGLLCMRCNRSLGMLNDSVETIEKLLAYRRKFE